MKRTIFVLLTMLVVLVAVFAVLVLRPLRKVRAGHGCSEATLHGNYGVVGSGVADFSETPAGPANFSMLATFDGKGGFTFTNLNYTEDGILEDSNVCYTGTEATYTVNSDCTCTFCIPASATPCDVGITAWGTVVDTSGGQLLGNLVSNPQYIAATFEAKRIAEGK